MSTALQRTLAIWMVLLVAALLLPLPHWVAILMLVAGLALLLVATRVTRRPARSETLFGADDLPDADYRQPVVLVCGDNVQEWPESAGVLTVPHGCWVRVAAEQALDVMVRQLLSCRPAWGSQLSVMICISPQQQQDRDLLSNRLLALRWQVCQLRRETGYSLPLALYVWVGSALVNQALWQAQLAGKPTSLWSDNTPPSSPERWLTAGGSMALQQQVLMTSLADWVRQEVVAVLTDPDADMPCATPVCIVQGLNASHDDALTTSLWTRWLQQHTALVQVAGWLPASESNQARPSLLPESVLPLLPKGRGLTPCQRACRGALWTVVMAGVVALCCSAWNNHQLLQRVAFDIAHYERIAMTDYPQKAAAIGVLHQDAAELDKYARHGAPLRLGLGLYQGGHLRLPLLEVIRSYVPPPPTPLPPPVENHVESIIRLDSLSLFDSGKAALNQGSTKTLVNSLVGIKAKPGWLIVVSGHTDNTGNSALNQTLSMTRAAAVRDWMRDTGDVPESCFAVQGYGAGRPVAPNDTAEGRALNRRVEISLVPQADACRMPGNTLTPSQEDGVDNNLMEK